MVYVMSDIHGCYKKYRAMLQKIRFCEEDTLYILGDVVDRGPDGLKTLLAISKRNNVVLLRGNHDQQAGVLLSNIHLLTDEEKASKMIPLYQMWLSDGGRVTLNEYLALSEVEQEKAIAVVKSSLLSQEIIVNGQVYLLAHTVPEVERVSDYASWKKDDYLMGEPDYEQIYFKDKVIITGHTPTDLIDPTFEGRIWKGNNHIAIDCGAGFGNALGCLCLDTMDEFYV